MSRLHALYRKRKKLINNMDSYYRIAFNCTKLLVWVALNNIFIVKRGKTLSFCGVNSFIFLFSFWLREVRIDLVRTSTILHVRLVPKIQPAPCYIPKIQVSCSQNWRLHNPRLAIPKLQRARKLPPAAKSRHAKSPFYPWAERAASSNRWGVLL